MQRLTSHLSARTRLFEYIRQEDLAEHRAATGEAQVAPDAIQAFQQVALQSLHRNTA